MGFFPPVNRFYAPTLIIEAVDSINGGAFVVAAQQEKILWVFNLVCEKQAYGLQRLLPSVYIVAQEQIVAFRGEASVFKQPEQVVVLAMDIACRGRQRSAV